jgi:O-antigen ligase
VKAGVTLQHLFRVLGYVAVFVMVRDVARRAPEKKWVCVAPIVGVALLEAGLGLVQGYLGGPETSVRGTYVNRNHFAGLLEMCLPFPVMYAMAYLEKSRKRFESPAGPALVACGALTVAAVILLGAVLSLSRMGFLATLFALLVTGLMVVRKRWIGVGLVAVLGVAGVAVLPTNALLLRFGDLAATEDISGDTRAQIWHDTWGLIGSYPLTGAGLGTFESAFLRQQRVAPMNTIDYAHNDYMQVMAELGIPGLLLMLAMAGRLVWVLGRARADRWLAIACMGSLAAIGLHSFVDYNLYIPANAMVLAWVAAVAEGVE